MSNTSSDAVLIVTNLAADSFAIARHYSHGRIKVSFLLF
jgi:hypothetical protein